MFLWRQDDYAQASLWVNEGLQEDYFQMLGAFDISVSNLPEAGPLYNITLSEVRWGRSVNVAIDDFDTIVFSGMYSRALNFGSFGGITSFEFLAFDSGIVRKESDAALPMWFGDAFVVYEPVPEPSTVALSFLAGGFLMHRYFRKRKAEGEEVSL